MTDIVEYPNPLAQAFVDYVRDRYGLNISFSTDASGVPSWSREKVSYDIFGEFIDETLYVLIRLTIGDFRLRTNPGVGRETTSETPQLAAPPARFGGLKATAIKPCVVNLQHTEKYIQEPR